MFADIEVVNLFTTRSSIDIKKNYFVSSWSANAVLLKVQRLHLCLNGANRKTAKQNTHTTPMNKKTKCTFKGEYNAKVGVCFMEKDQHNRVLSCMSAQGFCLLVAVIKGQNSEVTWPNHALFEFNQIYGSTLLITKAVVTSWMIFPVTSAAFVRGGGNQHIISKYKTNWNLVNKKIHATVQGQYDRKMKVIFHW